MTYLFMYVFIYPREFKRERVNATGGSGRMRGREKL